MSAHDDRLAPPATAHVERLAEAGAHLARIVHELNAPVSLLHGSLDNLAEYVIALLHHVAALPASASGGGGRHSAPAQSGAEYAAANAASLVSICKESVHRLERRIEELRAWMERPGRPLVVGPVDLRQVVADAVRLAGCDRERRVAVEPDMPLDLPPVLTSSDALAQVLTNVLANALDAVTDRHDAAVRLSARTTAPVAGEPSGPVVEVRIRDNGPGVPSAEREHIFEAFFTTKPSGASLGLGLAIARDLLQRTGGSLSLANGGPGAEFVIRLPAACLDNPPGL